MDIDSGTNGYGTGHSTSDYPHVCNGFKKQKMAFLDANRTRAFVTGGAGGLGYTDPTGSSIGTQARYIFDDADTAGLQAIGCGGNPFTFYADVTGDLISEILMYSFDNTYLDIIYSKPLQSDGSSAISVNTDITYFGYVNGSVCKDSDFILKARECNAGVAECTYTNSLSVSDRERIVTNCGDQFSEIQNGTFSFFNPEFTCPTNVTGTYNVRAYMQSETEVNAGSVLFNQFNPTDITYTVVDGVEGIDCNVVSNIVEAPEPFVDVTGGTNTTNTTTTNETVVTTNTGVDGFVNFLQLFGLDNNTARFLFAVIITLGLGIYVSISTQYNPLMTLIGTLLGLALSIVFGLIGIEIVIIGIIIAGLLVLLMRYFGMGNQTSGG